MADSHRLPPGQWIAPLERFGLPTFAPRKVVPPARPVVTVSGDVRHAAQFEIADLMAGLWYINLHTAEYPGGEIRGQVTQAQ